MNESIDEIDLVKLNDLEVSCRKIRHESNKARTSPANTKLHIEFCKIKYKLDRSFSREVSFFTQSNKSDPYRRRVSLVANVYIILSKEIMSSANNLCEKNKKYLPIASNDDYFNVEYGIDPLLALKDKLNAGKAFLAIIFCLFDTEHEIHQCNGSELYLQILSLHSKMIQLKIDSNWVALTNNWDKSSTTFKRIYLNVIEMHIQQLKEFQRSCEYIFELRELRPQADKLKAWQARLQKNQKEASKSTIKYSDDVKSNWLEIAKKLKEKNKKLSISSIAKHIASGKYNGYESIRKYLSTQL